MITRSQPASDQQRTGGAPHEPPQSVEGWLDLLETLMHLAPGRSRAIRDELKAHLDERVRDLVLAGRSEAEAVQQAIVELGDTAALARQLRHAHHTTSRRRIMQLSLLAAGIGAVTFSAFLIVPNGDQTAQIPVAAYQEAPPDHSQSAAFLDQTISVNTGETLGDFISRVAQIDDLDLNVHWDALSGAGVERDTQLDGASVAERPLRRALALVMHDLDEDGGIGWQVTDDLLEIAPQEVFDLRSRRLMAYDVRDLLSSLMADSDQSREDAAAALLQALHEIVERYEWEANGGTLATTNLLGGTLFIRAPQEMHEQVQWVLGQLGHNQARAGGEAPSGLATGGSPEGRGTIRRAPEEKLQRGDVLEVEIWELYEPGKWTVARPKLESDWTIHLPSLGGIKIVGISAAELEEDIRERLEGTVEDPKVIVRAFTTSD